MLHFPYKSFLRNFYLTIFFYEFIFAYAIYTLLFSIRGLSVFQISLLIAWWAFTSILFELPSGALADYWSRKKMLILAPVIKALCFLTWFFAGGNFYLYALGFTLWALSEAFVSGTSQALLYDTMVFSGKQAEYEKTWGRTIFFVYIALGISILSGGFIAAYDLDWAVIFSLIPLAASAFFASRLPQVPRVESTGELKYLEYFKTAFKEIRANHILVFFFVYLLSIYVFSILEEFDQLYFHLAGLPIFAFGIAGAVWSLLNAAGSFFAFRLKRLKIIYYLLPLIGGAMLVVVSRYPSIPMIGLLFLAYFVCSPLPVLIESKIQHNIGSESRATITSASNVIIGLAGVITTLLFGLISRIWNLQAIYLATGIFLFVFAAWVFIVRNKITR